MQQEQTPGYVRRIHDMATKNKKTHNARPRVLAHVVSIYGDDHTAFSFIKAMLPYQELLRRLFDPVGTNLAGLK